MVKKKAGILTAAVLMGLVRVAAVFGGGQSIECANLIYAGTRSSVCFSDQFLTAVSQETTVVTSRKFRPVKISDAELFDYPFAMMTGEGTFSLSSEERDQLRRYLRGGGFLLASAGCSSEPWNEAFRAEMKIIFPDRALSPVKPDHPLFRTVHDIRRLETKKEDAHLEGISFAGKLVVVYSPDGLNDTGSMYGCCCCGGNEIKNAQEVNSNIIVYALLQ